MPSAFAPYYAAVSVAGTTPTLLFDASLAAGHTGFWELQLANTDADAGDTVFIGFNTDLTASNGYPLGVAADTSEASKTRIKVPPHGKVYGVCTAAETRDVRVLATPLA